MHADLDLDRTQLIKDLQRGFSGEVPYDYITKLKYYDARLLLVFAGTSSGPDSYCTGAVVSKSGPLGDAQELFNPGRITGLAFDPASSWLILCH